MRLDGRRRGAVAAALAALVALAAYGCGSSGGDVSARGGRATDARPAARPGTGGASQTIRYHGVEFSAPGDWPVHDLEADPTTCVRFDQNAVYLGHPGADMRCPAVVVGHSDAVLVEPADGSTVAAAARSHANVQGQVNGLAVATDPSAEADQQVHATFPGRGVAVTISFVDHGRADEILGSFREATP
jgi:hypothetical protein